MAPSAVWCVAALDGQRGIQLWCWRHSERFAEERAPETLVVTTTRSLETLGRNPEIARGRPTGCVFIRASSHLAGHL